MTLKYISKRNTVTRKLYKFCYCTKYCVATKIWNEIAIFDRDQDCDRYRTAQVDPITANYLPNLPTSSK